MKLYISKEKRIFTKDIDNNFNSYNNEEEILIPKKNIIWKKENSFTIVLLDKNMKIVDEVYNYIKVLFNRQLSPNSIITFSYSLEMFYNFLEIYSLKFNKVESKHLNSFLIFLNDKTKEKNKKDISGKTLNNRIGHIREFYKYLNFFYNIVSPFDNEFTNNMNSITRNGLLSHISSKRRFRSIYKVKEKTHIIKIFTKEEYEKVLSFLPSNRDKLLFKFLILTGARIGEALSLKIKDFISFNSTNKIQVFQLSQNDLYIHDLRRRLKTGERTLYVPNWLWYELNNYYKNEWTTIWDETEFEHDFLFITNGNRSKGEPIAYNTIYTILKNVSLQTNIGFNIHDLRHTFATNLARNKVDITTIQKLLGHKSPSTCSIYIQLAKEAEISKELYKIYEYFEDDSS